MRPLATIRRSPEDFVVEEIPAFSPSGEGEHLYVEITKTNVTTNDAVRRICRALVVDERGASYAGMKDKRAVARQTVSIPFARERSVEEAIGLELDGIRVERATRHPHKLKPGQLKGNRFAIVLRDLAAEDLPQVVAKLDEAKRDGVPNSFGPQRFGRDGDNPERALDWLTGKTRGPSDRRERRLLFSALQAHLFNFVLERRCSEGTWCRPLAGDLLKKTDTGGMFLCTDPETDADRAERGEICPTGPIYGARMRWPEGEPAKIEREILVKATGNENPFEGHRALGEGSRRPLVLKVRELAVDEVREQRGALRVLFVLPKGGYATTLLTCAVALHEEMVTR